MNSSTITVQTVTVPWDQSNETKTDDLGIEWFCTAGIEQGTVYHSDIRYDLERYSEWFVPRSGRRYMSMLDAGTDDRTSYHPLFYFCGKDRADRPDCLFYLFRPSNQYTEEPTRYLLWNGKVVPDYNRRPVRALDLPLTISSKIDKTESARLETMWRSDPRVEWDDMLARILRRGATSAEASRIRHRLNMVRARFRNLARLLTKDTKGHSEALESYQLSTMNAEMVAKNTTKGFIDMEKEEKAFVGFLNRETNRPPASGSNLTPRQRKNRVTRRKAVKENFRRAEPWAQA